MSVGVVGEASMRPGHATIEDAIFFCESPIGEANMDSDMWEIGGEARRSGRTERQPWEQKVSVETMGESGVRRGVVPEERRSITLVNSCQMFIPNHFSSSHNDEPRLWI
jgi:hypothetical protein